MQLQYQSGFERAALRYDEHALQQRRTLEHLVDRILPLVKGSAHVLDAGCGTAYLQTYLQAQQVDWQLHGIDVSAAMCAVAKTRMPAVACADITHMPIADTSMDLIFSASALQWVHTLGDVYAEAYRVLKPEGMIAIATYVEGTLHELHQAMNQAGWPVWSFASLQAHKDALTAAGFVVCLDEVSSLESTYPSLRALLRSLKEVGANRYYPSTQPVMRPMQLRQLELCYDQQFLSAQGVKATWRIAYLLARKGRQIL